MNASDDLDKIEIALSSCIRAVKRPGYWEEFQRRAGVSIDRPAAAILMILSDSSLQFRELVNRLGVEAPSVSRKVHELEIDGLVTRNPTPDRRVHLLALTPTGHDTVRKLARARRDILSEVLKDWSANERGQLDRLLLRFAEDLQTRFGSRERQS